MLVVSTKYCLFCSFFPLFSASPYCELSWHSSLKSSFFLFSFPFPPCRLEFLQAPTLTFRPFPSFLLLASHVSYVPINGLSSPAGTGVVSNVANTKSSRVNLRGSLSASFRVHSDSNQISSEAHTWGGRHMNCSAWQLTHTTHAHTHTIIPGVIFRNVCACSFDWEGWMSV